MSDKICIVGIAGGTASGKTTIVRKIKETFGIEVPYWTDSLKMCVKNLMEA